MSNWYIFCLCVLYNCMYGLCDLVKFFNYFELVYFVVLNNKLKLIDIIIGFMSNFKRRFINLIDFILF